MMRSGRILSNQEYPCPPLQNHPNPRPTDQHEAIRRRAEEIYIRNGRIPGRDVENWAQAEQEILRESSSPATRRTAIVVKVNGVQYVGEYDLASANGYLPGEFGPARPLCMFASTATRC